MAKLHRFLKLNDRFDSQVFTFLLPGKLATDDNPDTYTKDVIYGYHKWTAYFIRTELHLGCFLKLQSACNGMKCQIDFSFTLLNREHFTRNETFIEKGCVFTTESSQHGRKNFVGLNDLLERDFLQVSGDYLIELEMRKINCSFECYVRIPRETHSRYASETKLESSYFTYGLFDWSISLYPNEGSIEQDENIAMQLHRHTSFDHICNVRYYVSIGENGAFQSEELDQLVDITGNGEVYIVNGSLNQLTRGRSSLRMKITMVSVVSISEVTLNIAGKSKSRAHLYDRDKQAWLMEADTTGKHLSFRLYYTDITHVPRKYSRYVCWNILVLTRYIPEHKVKTNYGPFARYYVQQDLDEGYNIMTSIPVTELQDENCLYTEPEDPRITVHIEWVDSHLLSQPNYHAYDDVDKLQKHQMKREIMALQSENFVLEKQLHSYQQSIAKTTIVEKDVEKEKEKEKNQTQNIQPNNVVDKVQSSREMRYNERIPTSTPTERKSSRDESGYYSDRTTSSYYNEKMASNYTDKPRNDRPKNEGRRSSSSSRDGKRDRNYDRSNYERSNYDRSGYDRSNADRSSYDRTNQDGSAYDRSSDRISYRYR